MTPQQPIEQTPPEGCRRWTTVRWQRSFQRALCTWFQQHQRDLPWRTNRDPYCIWISEIMLQQTQVATVIDFFHRFIARFPDVTTLANADQAEVLRYWEGLGYYRRARQMHLAAQTIVSNHAGIFPRTFEAVLALPGIGRYTAGAILSIAHDARLPILEANTIRLLSRLSLVRHSTTAPAVQQHLWNMAAALLPAAECGTFNQALMELGSLVCTPQNPACNAWPVARLCSCKREGLQTAIPVKSLAKQYQSVTEHAVAVRDSQQRLWLRQRTRGERWEGLWDFPRFDIESQHLQASVNRAVGFAVTLGDQIASLQHAVTRFRITLKLFQATPRRQPVASSRPRHDQPTAGAWYTPSQVARLPLTKPARRLVAMLPPLDSQVTSSSNDSATPTLSSAPPDRPTG